MNVLVEFFQMETCVLVVCTTNTNIGTISTTMCLHIIINIIANSSCGRNRFNKIITITINVLLPNNNRILSCWISFPISIYSQIVIFKR